MHVITVTTLLLQLYLPHCSCFIDKYWGGGGGGTRNISKFIIILHLQDKSNFYSPITKNPETDNSENIHEEAEKTKNAGNGGDQLT